MTTVRSDNGTRIGVVVSAAALVVAVSLPLTAMADRSGTAGGSTAKRAAKTAGDRGQQGLDRAREAGAQPQPSESATGKDNKGGGPA